MSKTNKKANKTKWPAYEYELEVLQGIEQVALDELSKIPLVRDIRGFRFWFAGDPERLKRLRSAVAVYRVKEWNVPRPRGLLGHQQLHEVIDFLKEVIDTHRSFRLSAAGKESLIMQRLAEAIAEHTGLTHIPEEGDLLIRLRPTETGDSWEVLARQTPLPLSARSWRVCNRLGGLNATIAYAAHKLSGFRHEDRIFNPMCGSGTLMIERALMGPFDAMVGVDIDADAVSCAQKNAFAARKNLEFAQVDALDTGLPNRQFDLIVTDLPWGDAIGSHDHNESLYPAFLKEMHRLCSKNGRVCIVTHEIKMFENLLRNQDKWRVKELFQVYSGGHHPKAYLLGRQ